MQDFLLNIDNKEILFEILHHSIDYLIGNRNDQDTVRLCHKYGFQNSDDFMLTTRTIARCYRNCCTEGATEADLLTDFANLSPELQRLVPAALDARRPEIQQYLKRHYMAQEHPLVESFNWDLRLVMGDSSYAQNQRLVATITLNCRNAAGKPSTLHLQMDPSKCKDFISELENSLKDSAEPNKE